MQPFSLKFKINYRRFENTFANFELRLNGRRGMWSLGNKRKRLKGSRSKETYHRPWKKEIESIRAGKVNKNGRRKMEEVKEFQHLARHKH